MKVLLAFVSLALLTVVYTQTCPRCTPLCVNGDGTDKVCGDDGCGGSCGTCPGGNYCCRGTCNCLPNCAGRSCGDDGCGYESCGRCSPGQTCSNGVCVGTSTRDCANRVCGADTFGGSCGSCPAGQRCRGGACECYYSCEERNCGNAMQDEGANLGLCPARSCGTCPTGYDCSNGMCNVMVPCDVEVTVVDCNTRAPIVSTASVAIFSATLSYSTTLSVSSGLATIWQTPGLGSFEFTTTASGYLTGTETQVLDANTRSVQVCVTPSTVLVDVRNRATDVSIEVSASITYSGFASGSFQWNGITTWTHQGFGQYTLVATPASRYTVGSETVNLDVTVSLIIIYVDVDIFCGDGTCNGVENFDTCELDCVALFLEFENADGSGPVNGMLVNFYLTNPRDLNQATGPNKNSAQIQTSRETGSASNTVYQGTYSYNVLVYFEAIVTGFINFYWRADTTNIDPGLGSYRLRVHSSTVLGATNFNYRVVNTWKPIDATPEPFGPTDLNLHLFHPEGALDINNPELIVGGFSVGTAVADSKQSGGPATMDISPGNANLVAIWNSKPPRSRAIAPSQAGRYIVNSGSYVVIYGKTSNAATGKQLGQIVLDELFLNDPARQNDQVSDLWYAGNMFVNTPGQDQPTISAVGTLKAGTITSTLDLIFDCEAYAYCSQFVVPYSDTGR